MNVMRISIAFAAPDRQQEVAAELPEGVTLQEGLVLLADVIEELTGSADPEATGVWGKVKPLHTILRHGDRLEFYRSLKADPKQARRARVGKQVNRS